MSDSTQMGIHNLKSPKGTGHVPRRFNLAIDCTNTFFAQTPATISAFVNKHRRLFALVRMAEECLAVFDGPSPEAKAQERERRRNYRPIRKSPVPEHNYIYNLLARIRQNEILIEENSEESEGEGECKILSFSNWNDRTLPVLCYINDNDFFSMTTHSPPFVHLRDAIPLASLDNVKVPNNINLRVVLNSNRNWKRVKINNEKDIGLAHYRITQTEGVIDFWGDMPPFQRHVTMLFVNCAFGNDYVMGLFSRAPQDKVWDMAEEWSNFTTGRNLVRATNNDNDNNYPQQVPLCYRDLKNAIQFFAKEIRTMLSKTMSLCYYEIDEDIIDSYLYRLLWNYCYCVTSPCCFRSGEVMMANDMMFKIDTPSKLIQPVRQLMDSLIIPANWTSFDKTIESAAYRGDIKATEV